MDNPRGNRKMGSSPAPNQQIGILQSISYALPVAAVHVLITPMNIIQGIYAKHYGLALTTLASIMLLSRFIDAISDPIIGYLSDRYRVKHGTRKPFIVAGGLAILMSGYFLYVPAGDVTTFYAGFWIITFYIAFTLFEIPHLTWPCDITTDSVDRTKLYSYRVFAGYIGLVLFYGTPLLPLFESNAITPETLEVSYFLVALLTIPLLLLAVRKVPDGKPNQDLATQESLTSRASLRELFRGIRENKPFLLFLCASACGGLSTGMWYGLIYIYVDAYLGMSEQFAQLFLLAFVVGLIVTPVWYRVALYAGKKITWMLAVCLMIFSYVFTGFLEAGEASFIQLLVLKTFQTCGFVCINIVTVAMLSEIVDYGQWKTGREERASYFSANVLLGKTCIASGMALGLAMAGWWGFDVSANIHSSESIAGLKLAIAWIPAALAALSQIFIAFSPINEHRHGLVRAKLDARMVQIHLQTTKSIEQTKHTETSANKEI